MRQAHNLRVVGSNPTPPQPILVKIILNNIFSKILFNIFLSYKLISMFEKVEILIIVFVLLFVFYLVIWLGAGKKNKSSQSPEISSYLFGVRVLIIIIAIVSLILWFFL